MKKTIVNSIKPYFFASFAIFGWWIIAFAGTIPTLPNTSHNNNTPKLELPPPKYNEYLSRLDRELIQKALSGDVPLMVQLISEWDVDAQILHDEGINNIRRLSRSQYARAQIIGRKLLYASQKEIETIRQSLFPISVLDDRNTPFELKQPLKRFLPQTYVSANFLLSLAEPENIVAIPNGIRGQNTFYPHSLTEKIPLDIERYNSEKIFCLKPELAFIANYSNPSTVQALSNQSIPVFSIDKIHTIEDIQHSVQRMGYLINRPLKGELLSLFIESAMLAIDNQLLATYHSTTEIYGTTRVIFLQYHSHFSIPTDNVIIGRLLKRIESPLFSFLTPMHSKKAKWSIPIEVEELLHLDPDFIIIANTQPEILKKQFESNSIAPLLQSYNKNNLRFIDSAPHRPDQFAVLAYYDIAQALIKKP